MKFAVLQFPGSNCDQDCVHVLQNVLGHPTRLLWHKESVLGDVDAVLVPGGFSYGDYLRTGSIARFSPVMAAVQEFAERGIAGITITSALDARYISSLKDDREAASAILQGPAPFDFSTIDRAQLIDDVQGVTLASASSLESSLGVVGKNNIEASAKVGAALAERAKKAGVEECYFDRGGFLFHGGVKALADAAREGGLKF